MAEPRELPAWITKRDGRLVPFEPDRISQALFAASEALGRADAFLARELADGVLHFVAEEFAATATPTTAQIAELVAKVTRELGQPSGAEGPTRHSTKSAPEMVGAMTASSLLVGPSGRLRAFAPARGGEATHLYRLARPAGGRNSLGEAH